MKKFLSASKLSCMVVKSEYANVWFVLMLYPTPAGDYKNSKFETVCHEYGLGVSLSPSV